MNSQRLPVAVFLLSIFAVLFSVAAAAESDAWSTPTVTHIEYDGEVFSKFIEMTRDLPASLMPSGSPDSRNAADLTLLGIFQMKFTEAPNLLALRVSLFKIPFNEAVILDEKIASLPCVDSPVYDENPIKKVIHFDKPLISLVEGVGFIAQQADSETLELGNKKDRTIASRVRFLDSLVFRLMQRDSWIGGQVEEEWVRIPFVHLYSREDSRTRWALRIVDSSFFSVFRHVDEIKEKEKETGFLQTFIASVFKAKKNKHGDLKWVLFEVPMSSLFYYEGTPHEKRITLLGTTSMSSSFGKKDNPAFALWNSHVHSDGTAENMYLRLPFVGPVWANWDDEGQNRRGPFPRLTFWRHYPY